MRWPPNKRPPVNKPRARLRADPPSPCISVCALDEDGVCQGCLRTIEEIGNWSSMSAADKHAVLDRIAEQTFDASGHADTKPTSNASDSGSHS